MYIALSVRFGQDDQLIFAQQLGVEQVVVEVEEWDQETLEKVNNRVEKTGLRLAGVEGLAVAEENVGRVQATLEAASQAGIGLVGCTWKREGHTQRLPSGRGRALVGARTDAEEREEWAHFVARLALMAGEMNVCLACCPPSAGALDALLESAPTPHLGLDLHPALLGRQPDQALRRCGQRVFMVQVGNFLKGREAFLDEGEVDVPGLLQNLKEIHFAGLVRAAPPPGMVGDTDWGHKGRAFDLGYLKAVLQTLESP